jgi:ATP-dependent helicase/nuclease subunit B
MAVQFILGRSGSGKTSYCIRAIVDALLEPGNDQPLIMLVPEQATYQAERAILSDKRIVGYNRLNVLSFDRLQFWLIGKNTARPGLSRIGQQMIIQRILRDNAGELKIFGPSASWPGLGRQIAQTIIELHQYAKTPDDINGLLIELQKDKRNNLAVLKLADIGLILQQYLKFIEGRFIDPDIQLTRACRAVSGASFAKRARLWVDGFASLTASELAILVELLKVVADAQIALCLDPSNIDLAKPDVEKLNQPSLFSPTERTYAAIIEAIKKSKLKLAKPIILERAVRFGACCQLAHIERHIFTDTHRAKKQQKASSKFEAPQMTAGANIRVISAPNARAEVRFVARQILQLVKERDYRYRDIAVIASDIDSYQHYVKAYFGDYGIPFFIDKAKPLNQHPVVQLICSALRAVTGGFSNSDIFACLKTDLVPIERCEVDLLENYCVAFGISGNDWIDSKHWHFAGRDNEEFDEERVNEIRQKVIAPLLGLREKLCHRAATIKEQLSAAEFTAGIFDFLEALHVRESLGRWIEEAVERKDHAKGDEHRQLYDKLLDVFDELVEVFAGQQVSAADYLAIISSAFSQLTLAFIPPTLDQVLVGSIERSRHPDLKAVFLVGVTQRQFPIPVSFGSILTEDDRMAVAESADFPLGPGARQSLADRQYLAYIAFTRPSEFLCISYPSIDDKGSAVVGSQFITELESLFADLAEESITAEQIDVEKVHNEMELADLLCSQLGRDSLVPETSNAGQLSDLWGDICSDDQFTQLRSGVFSALSYDNRAQLSSDIAEKLFGQRITSSATKLSTFAACPYRYFARYVLELKERAEFKLEPLDVGVFYHRVLDALLKSLNAEGVDFATVRQEQLLQLLKEQISELATEDSFISNFVRRSAHNAFIIQSAGQYLEDCVQAIAEMVRAGSFRPGLSEVAFGEPDSVLGRYELSLPDGRLLSLNGKIDRLDTTEFDGSKAVIIFDYKRKSESFNWAELHYGIDMQLPIYMLAVRDATGSKIRNSVGAFYMPVEVAPEKTTLDELSEQRERFGYKARGIFNGQFFQLLDRSNSNRFYNFFVTKKGDQYGYGNISGALRPAAFGTLLQFTERKMIALAEEILSGKIEVKPYRLNRRSPCGYCEYRPACRFDWQINDYNFLESLNKSQVLQKIGAVDA